MDDENLYQRVPKGDPRQCQAVTAIGQCQIIAIEGSDKCVCHGGAKQDKKNKNQAMRSYLAAQWQHQVGDMADSDDLKSLKTEIGILRIMLVKIMNSCKNDSELMMRSGTISDLVIKVQKVVESCHRLDSAWGVLLDKTQVAQFGQMVIQLVSTYITDPETLQSFAGALVAQIESASKSPFKDQDRGSLTNASSSSNSN